jgi:hypothetical protein
MRQMMSAETSLDRIERNPAVWQAMLVLQATSFLKYVPL